MPVNVLDLYTEFRNATNGLGRRPAAASSAPWPTSAWTISRRRRRMPPATWSCAAALGTRPSARRSWDYCASDVTALERLLARMAPGDRLAACCSCAGATWPPRLAWSGTGPDRGPMLEVLRARWDAIKSWLIDEVDAAYGVFENGTLQARTVRAVPCSRRHRLAPPGQRAARPSRRRLPPDRPGRAPRGAFAELRVSLSQDALGRSKRRI